ncbi:hypothetical protein AK812_SmicGene45448 [Symbiodinium microadriaticum]|uniref:Integrase catalytic domain-containing protein n=1 Tax=Symbiodinium microadriaticum TaxID=2951 RepID=A0A1Q9BW47_SYMMI|nr:hypothetical protein AK812_SmicGene45448 [Symbiodinium microadriaticum]
MFVLDTILQDEIAGNVLCMAPQGIDTRELNILLCFASLLTLLAAKMKYLLVAKFTIPESYVTGEFEPTGSDPLDEEVGSKDLFDEEDNVYGGGDDGLTVGASGEDRDPGEAVVGHETGAGVGSIPLDVEAPKATYLLFAEPLLNDKGPTIASAIQSIVLYLQSLNIPVLRFHCDRGVPQGNGAAESAVKELKHRTRKTLSTSGLEKPFWPVAAKAVASMQRARVLRQVPKMIASFGSKVLVKKRRYAASGALIRLEFEERRSEGLYLGLSDQVADGHLVYVDGTFTHTRSVRDKAKLVDAKEHQPDESGTIGSRGHSPDLEYHDGDPDGRGDDVSERVVVAPRVAVRDGKLVLEHYDETMMTCHVIRKTSMFEFKGSRRLEVIMKIGVLVWQFLNTIQIMNPMKMIHMVTRISRKTTVSSEHAGSPPKAWASGVYRHGGVLGVRNSTKDYPLATKVVNLFIQEKLGEQACWSTFSMHRNLNVKKHRDSHNARDKVSYLIPVSNFKDGGLWVQLKADEEADKEDIVILDGERGESQQPQRMEVELEPMEAFMHIRMTEEEWNTTSSRYGANHYLAGMAARWEHINPSDDDLNSVIPAAIVEDLERDWVQNPRMVFVDDEGEELHVGSMMAMTTARVPSFEPGGMSSDWIKACKVYNAVLNIEEMIVLWVHRRVVVHPVESDGPRADGGDPPIPEMDFRGGIPRLAMMCAQEANDLMKFVEVGEDEISEEEDVRMMKASPENIYTPNIETIISKVSPGSPLKVTHTVDP